MDFLFKLTVPISLGYMAYLFGNGIWGIDKGGCFLAGLLTGFLVGYLFLCWELYPLLKD